MGRGEMGKFYCRRVVQGAFTPNWGSADENVCVCNKDDVCTWGVEWRGVRVQAYVRLFV